MNRTYILIVIGVVLVVIGARVLMDDELDDGGIACTQDAKLCPDGSYVGRTGPSCAFAPCPSPAQSALVVPVVSGTLSGTVTTSPTCPVEHNPPDPACAPRPYQTTIEVRRSGQSTVFATAKSNSKGAFTIVLPTGTYDVQAKGGTVLPRCGMETVTIRSRTITTLDISCDSGIR